jgi:putative cell wall-binding protein
MAELGPYTAGSVTRLAGADRYGTAASLAVSSFGGPVDRVLIATGEGFADALVGGAVGAATSSPVLLVGRRHVPATTADALRRLQPREVTVLGGPDVVSESVLAALRGLAVGSTVSRVSGQDRFGTAASLVRRSWPQTSSVVYLATGRDFPDALSGVAASAQDAAPLLLTEPGCLPAATKAELDRLRPSTIVTLGGTATVSAAAAGGLVCSTSTDDG